MLRSIITTLFISVSLGAYAQWLNIPSIPPTSIVDIKTYEGGLYAASAENKLYYSHDVGKTWSSISLPDIDAQINSIEIISDTLFVGTLESGIYFKNLSVDQFIQGGKNFIAISGFTKFNNNFYASSVGSGTLKYDKQQNQWIAFNSGLPNYSKNVDAIYNSGQSLIALAGANGTFYSFNFSTNMWEEKYFFEGYSPGLSMRMPQSIGNDIICTNGYHILRSEDDGISWHADKNNLINGVDRVISVGLNKQFVATNLLNNQAIVYTRHVDAPLGSTWEPIAEIFEHYIYNMVELNNKLFIASEKGLYVRNQVITNVPEPSILPVEIGPNPVKSSSSIVVNGSGITSVLLYDPHGHQVALTQQEANKYRLPDMAPGLYFVQIISKGEKITKRIVVI